MLCFPALIQIAGAQSYNIFWSGGLLHSFCAAATAILGCGTSSKILFQDFVGNVLSFVLRQNGNILICQEKKHLQKHKIIFSLFQFHIWLEEEELCLSGGNASEGKSLLGQVLVSHTRAMLTGLI